MDGLTVTCTGGTTVTLAVPMLGALLRPLVAVTVTVCGLPSVAGAEYRPSLEIVPTAGLTDHETAVLNEPATVAENCCVWPTPRVTAPGDTLTGGAATDIPKDWVACLPAASWTCTLNVYEPGVDDVPARVPPPASVIPGGKLPETTAQAYGAVPPYAESVAL